MLIYTRRKMFKIIDEWIDAHDQRIRELVAEDPMKNSNMILELTGAVKSFRGLKDELVYGRKYFDNLREDS